MGAWAGGPFDNDDAADFAGDLSATGDAQQAMPRLQEVLTAVADADGYVEAPEMNVALAAAAIVAMIADPTLPIPSSVDQSWLESARSSSSSALNDLATQVFARALQPDNNEWFELWAEADLLDEVREHLAPFSSALA